MYDKKKRGVFFVSEYSVFSSLWHQTKRGGTALALFPCAHSSTVAIGRAKIFFLFCGTLGGGLRPEKGEDICCIETKTKQSQYNIASPFLREREKEMGREQKLLAIRNVSTDEKTIEKRPK